MLKFFLFVLMIVLCVIVFFEVTKILKKQDEVIKILVGIIFCAIIFMLFSSFVIPFV